MLPKIYQQILLICSLICSGIIIYTTQSFSALLALVIGLISIVIYQQRYQHGNNWIQTKVITPFFSTRKQLPHWLWVVLTIMIISPVLLVLFIQIYPENLSLLRRVWLNIAAVQIITENLAVGTGLNQFTAAAATVTVNNEVIRFNQPVHHVGLLWLAETGVLGLIWLSSFILTFKHKLPWTKLAIVIFTLLPIAILDHYLLSLQTGRLLTVVFILLIVIDQQNSTGWQSITKLWSR